MIYAFNVNHLSNWRIVNQNEKLQNLRDFSFQRGTKKVQTKYNLKSKPILIDTSEPIDYYRMANWLYLLQFECICSLV